MLYILDNKKQKVRLFATIVVVILLTISIFLIIGSRQSGAKPVPIIFPIVGGGKYSNDYNAYRSLKGNTKGCEYKHCATDIFANKRRGIVSATDGTITYVGYPEPSWGYMVVVRGSDGYTYNYLHLNNDTPGTDNGKGGGMHAYAPDIQRGNPIKKGQLIGYVGDSGNAENTPPHLHFEMFKDNKPVNPYESLRAATKINSPRTYPQLPNEYLPYGVRTNVDANIAIGNFDSDLRTNETVVAAGKGGGPHIKTYNSNGTTISSFFAYNREFRGGVDVAAGDIDGDGIDEIVTGAGEGGGPHVRIFKRDGTLVGQFMAYDKFNRSGIRVAIADINGDGQKEIVTVPQVKSGPHVRAFTLKGKIVSSFFAYNKENRKGLDVSAADIDGDGVAEIITGAGEGSGPHVRAFDQKAKIKSSFFVYNSKNRSGVKVSAADVVGNDTKAEIVVAPASSGGPDIKVLDANGKLLRNKMFLEEWWRSGYDVAAGKGIVRASAGDNARRTTVRDVFRF